MQLRLILGDQLNAAHSWYREHRDDVVYVMMETRSETDYVRHHAQKVLALFAAMRRFAQALQAAGHRVHYLRIGDAANRHDIAANLAWLAAHYGASSLACQLADERRVDALLAALPQQLGLPLAQVDSEHFYTTRDEAARLFGSKGWRMETFYRRMRQQHGVLLDVAGKPEGGQWNYDAANREPYRGEVALAPWPFAAHDLSALWQEIVDAGVQTLGEPQAAALPWPLTRREARDWLADFIHHRLRHFGRYQDALVHGEAWLFHSGLSFALNSKMLSPHEVVHAAEAAWRSDPTLPLASVEGFIRQILGWREYVRGVYWARPDFGSVNALQHQRPLPRWFWDGNTGMACVAQAVRGSLQHAYAHHIQRLMVTGNIALLLGCDPDEVDAWYLGIYIDAFEWVEQPNTRGMSQWADGGFMASKPYVSGGAYLARMGDHCAHCRYSVKQKTGPGACPFNSLYWHFLARHEATLAANHRLAMPYASWRKMDEGARQALLTQAEAYLQDADSL